MTALCARLLAFFHFKKTEKGESEARFQLSREQERDIVKRLARGNLSLQEGRYLTREDIEKMRRELYH